MGLVEPLTDQVRLLDQGEGDFGVHPAAVSGSVAEHTDGVEFLEYRIANNLLKKPTQRIFFADTQDGTTFSELGAADAKQPAARCIYRPLKAA